MILNPDGFVVFWLFISLFIAVSVAGIFFRKNNSILAVVFFIIAFILFEFVGFKIEKYFENELIKLTQPVMVKYKRIEPTKYGNQYYLTSVFNNGCVSDILVDYQTYRESSEGGIVTIVPNYQIYVEVLQQNCRKK